MSWGGVSAVLFVKDLEKAADFYSTALGMSVVARDEYHSVLSCHGFELVVHRIPEHIARSIALTQPPERRVGGAIRLDFPVESVEKSRAKARTLGGAIDEAPPEWADKAASFFLGYDPEGNQFGVRSAGG
jgi:catechol 2,3-dioxygenase-like lactoylglutathione lyase family enzyme